MFGPRSTEFEPARDDVSNEKEDEDDEKHPGDALQRLDDRPVNLEDPPLLRQDEWWIFRIARIDILLQRPDANAAGNAHDIEGKQQVTMPRAREVRSNDAVKNALERAAEESRDSERYGQRDRERYGKKREEHFAYWSKNYSAA